MNKDLQIPFGKEHLDAILTLAKDAKGIVLFAHGSGSSRLSPRNQYVANFLAQNGLSSLLLDLLTPQEEAIDLGTRQYRFDIPLLAERLIMATKWIQQNADTKDLKVGYFGSSTGASAALIAAAELKEAILAVVSRGGRSDLAGVYLEKVTAPTLLIVGGDDDLVLELNQESLKHLNKTSRLEIVPHATHLFEEKGALEQVSRLATNWFKKYLK